VRHCDERSTMRNRGSATNVLLSFEFAHCLDINTDIDIDPQNIDPQNIDPQNIDIDIDSQNIENFDDKRRERFGYLDGSEINQSMQFCYPLMASAWPDFKFRKNVLELQIMIFVDFSCFAENHGRILRRSNYVKK
jgi:hypothetical protein